MMARRAFTLLELLLATVLTTLLMVGVLAVITRLGAPSAGAQSTETAGKNALDSASVEPWLRLLRDDMSQVQYVDVSKANVLLLEGNIGLSHTCEQTHRPVQVQYVLETIGERSWVVRRQVGLDRLTNQNIQRDLVCSGVSRFELGSGSSGSQPAQHRPVEPSISGDAWRLRVWIAGRPEPLHDRLVAVRRSGA